MGEGQVSFEAGLRLDIPKTHTIQITHKDLESFQTEIRNKIDVRTATAYTAISLGIGLLETFISTFSSGTDSGSYYIGLVTILISPSYFLTCYKFKDIYSYDLTE